VEFVAGYFHLGVGITRSQSWHGSEQRSTSVGFTATTITVTAGGCWICMLRARMLHAQRYSKQCKAGFFGFIGCNLMSDFCRVGVEIAATCRPRSSPPTHAPFGAAKRQASDKPSTEHCIPHSQFPTATRLLQALGLNQESRLRRGSHTARFFFSPQPLQIASQ
jgi:hypothetical protein